MERLKEALRRLRDAAKRGNQPDAAAAVKDINDAVGKQVALARAAAARTKVAHCASQLALLTLCNLRTPRRRTTFSTSPPSSLTP